MRNKKKDTNVSKLTKVLAASLVLNPALYMLSFEKAFMEAVSTPSYKAPFVSKALPDFHTAVGTPLTLDLNQYFGEVASYSAEVSNLTSIAAKVNGSSLTLTGNQFGTTTVSITGLAANGGTVTDTFDVSVIPDSLDKNNNGNVDIGEIAAFAGSRPMTKNILQDVLSFISPKQLTTPNSAPKAKDIPITVYRNSSTILEPNELFSDEDLMTIDSFSLSPTGNVTEGLDHNQLKLTALGHTADPLTLVTAVRDGRGGKASNRYKVTVGNRSPVFTGTDLTVTRGTYSPTINLSQLFTKDPDGDTLQLGTVDVSPAGAVSIDRTSDSFRVYGAVLGSATVTASAYDAYGGTTTGSFKVAVQNSSANNNPPQYDSKLNILVNKAIDPSIATYAPFTIDLTNAFTDADYDPITYTVTSSNDSIAKASISDNLLTITPKDSAHGDTVVTVTARDDRGGSSFHNFNLTFNKVPTFTGTIGNPTSPFKIQPNKQVGVKIAGFFSDGDSDKLKYSATSSLGGTLNVTFSSGDLTMVNISNLSKGSNTVTLTATDGYGGSVSSNPFQVVVENQAPVPNSSSLSKILVKGNPVKVSASDLFTDADGDSMTLTSAVLSTTGIIESSLTSGALTLKGVSAGSSTVTLTANDGYDTATSSMTVNVYDGIPFSSRMIMTGEIKGGYAIVNQLSKYFDKDDFSIADVVSSEPEVIKINKVGSNYQVEAVTAGGGTRTTTIMIKASNKNGAVLEDKFDVTVYDADKYYVVDQNKNKDIQPIDLNQVFLNFSLASPTFTKQSEGDPDYISSAYVSGNLLILPRSEGSKTGSTSIKVQAVDSNKPSNIVTKTIQFNFYEDLDDTVKPNSPPDPNVPKL